MRIRPVHTHRRVFGKRRLLFFFQAEDGIRDTSVTGVQTCALPICVTDDPAVKSPCAIESSVASRRSVPAPTACRETGFRLLRCITTESVNGCPSICIVITTSHDGPCWLLVGATEIGRAHV